MFNRLSRWKKIFVLLAGIMLLISACGAHGTPENASVREQSSVVKSTNENVNITTITPVTGMEKILYVLSCREHFACIVDTGVELGVVYLDREGRIVSRKTLEKVPDVPQGMEEIRGADINGDYTLTMLYSDAQKVSEGSASYLLCQYDEEGGLTNSKRLDSEYAFHSVLAMDNERILLCGMSAIVMIENDKEVLVKEAGANMAFLAALKKSTNDYCVVAYADGVPGVFQSLANDEFLPLSNSVMPTEVSYSVQNNATPLVTADVLYQLDTETHQLNARASWDSLSIKGSNIKSVACIDNETILLCLHDTPELYLLSVERREEQREVIKVGAIREASPSLGRFVTYFNDTNEEYEAEIVYYEDQSALITSLSAGNGPDIMEISGVSIPFTPDKFVDMNTLSGNAVGAVEKSIKDALLIEGALTTVPSSFWIKTIVGRESDVGPNSGWSVRELVSLSERRGDGTDVFPPWMTGDELMRWICNISLGQFVDWTACFSRFDSDDFAALLEFCADQPQSFDVAEYISDYEPDILLTVQLIQSEKWIGVLKENYGGHKITYIGFPNESSNNGSFFSRAEEDVIFAIPLSSQSMNGAEAVIACMLSEGWQEKTMSMPVNSTVLEHRLEALLNLPEMSVTDEDIEKLRKLIEETTVFIHYDDTITQIVMEEVQSFFDGSKTASEVGKIIDSRIDSYLNE
ncbi:MAG: hypothetical protein IJQ12_03095 [Lachnospiraceae bacterium]|nr:hypothetical protein [Lachnospiraceae bacterium]